MKENLVKLKRKFKLTDKEVLVLYYFFNCYKFSEIIRKTGYSQSKIQRLLRSSRKKCLTDNMVKDTMNPTYVLLAWFHSKKGK